MAVAYFDSWVGEGSADVRVAIVIVGGRDGRCRAHAQAELAPRGLEQRVLGALTPALADGLAPRESVAAMVITDMREDVRQHIVQLNANRSAGARLGTRLLSTRLGTRTHGIVGLRKAYGHRSDESMPALESLQPPEGG